ncbi:hypothetical protein VU12_03275 [Desulfobulbus sp. US4]|nr:hypothetical protein [Desulfobulbus sp. US4]
MKKTMDRFNTLQKKGKKRTAGNKPASRTGSSSAAEYFVCGLHNILSGSQK